MNQNLECLCYPESGDLPSHFPQKKDHPYHTGSIFLGSLVCNPFFNKYCSILHRNPAQGITLFEIQKPEYF